MIRGKCDFEKSMSGGKMSGMDPTPSPSPYPRKGNEDAEGDPFLADRWDQLSRDQAAISSRLLDEVESATGEFWNEGDAEVGTSDDSGTNEILREIPDDGQSVSSVLVGKHSASIETDNSSRVVVLDSSDPFEAAMIRMVEVNRRKRADYALDSDVFSNFRQTAAALCIPGFDAFAAVEFNVAQKTARLVALRSNGRDPRNESVADTVMDRAVYCVIAYALLLSEGGS